MTIRYISDLHIYDPSIFDWRPQFSTHEKMNEYLYDRWNTVVQEDDIVIIAGDVGECLQKTTDLIKELKGQKILVLGNHDYSWGRELYACGAFAGIFEYLTTQGVMVAHIPDERFDSPKYYYVHGHHHRYDMLGMKNKYEDYIHHPLRLNCSADILDFAPRTLNELITSKEILIEKMEEIKHGTEWNYG